MKAFEKWWKDYLTKASIDKWHELMLKQMKPLYKFIWKAALEWIFMQRTKILEKDGSTITTNCINADIIENELENE